ncbi:AMP-binding protein [Campylobacter ureolyticus]|uniref:AMP-binding protein n=1 Tax=Campylobacter ureolyticus TaxID=827 RepID=UPI00215AFC02|nr:AMP-binding protein [Campylobacter ureolyticus]MCR8700011.1 AMP-binding protein [Campylobacter ureolyticus]
MFSKELYFILEKKSLKEVFALSVSFSKWLNDNKIKEISINLNNIYEFFIAFFGTCNAKAKCFINANEGYVLNDADFAKIDLVHTQDELLLDENFEFFVKTSGSSSKSKNIKKTFYQMINEAKALDRFLNLKEKTFFSSVPHLHLFGLTFRVFLPLISGGKIYSTTLNYPEIMQKINFKNGIFITSPTILKAIHRHNNLPNLAQISLMISAGSKLNDDLRKNLISKYNIKIMEIYGSSETGVIARKFEDEFEIFDEVEICTKEDDRFFINSMWCKDFLSNDVGKVDGNKLILSGRLDRIVKLNDVRFNLDDAENLLKTHEFISDAKCGILNNDNRVSTIITLSNIGKKAFLKGGKKFIVDELKALSKNDFKTNLRHFKIIEEIPYNENGKFKKDDFLNIFKTFKTPFIKKITDKKIDENSSLFEFEIYTSEESFFYEGHFNTFPITPGFIEIGFIYDALESLEFNINMIKAIENIKFTALLRPFEKVILTIKKDKNIFNCQIKGDKIYASARVKFEDKKE